MVFSKGKMMSVSDISESVNELTNTDQQKITFHILGVRRQCRWNY